MQIFIEQYSELLGKNIQEFKKNFVCKGLHLKFMKHPNKKRMKQIENKKHSKKKINKTKKLFFFTAVETKVQLQKNQKNRILIR